MAMKAAATSALLAGLAVAHSGVWNIEVDGIKCINLLMWVSF
jgi:hypothetical protein